ncbi:MAG: hypothetical protein KC900_04275 [Candidatus Omnitrophica bacterium]|nr:hypothetical protein [Candidatus Omnitrophota bacterium]
MKTSTRSGKVLTIFLVIIAVLLITLTALSMFFYNVEIDKRKGAEGTIAMIEKELEQAKIQLKDFQKKNSILGEKNKEADNRVNGLMDELDLEKGLREELKKESIALKEKLQELQQQTSKVEDKTATQIGDLEQQIVELEAKLKVELNRNKDLQKKNEELLAAQEELTKKAVQNQAAQQTRTPPPRQTASPDSAAVQQTAPPRPRPTPTTDRAETSDPGQTAKAVQGGDTRSQPRPNPLRSAGSEEESQMNIELDQIVVTPDVHVSEEELLRQIKESTRDGSAMSDSGAIPEGRILSVDVETAFVVINLGRKHGISNGIFMSVYRGNDYLGDIKITRTQEEMAAADLVPPLSGNTLRKNDQVIAK